MIYFVRHGETDFNLFSVTQGQIDTSLNKTGLKQAQKVAKDLKDCHFDIIISSPLTRTVQTAEAIMAYHPNNQLILDKRIMEVSKGILEGTKNTKDIYDDFFKDPHKYNGESEEDVFKRVSSFLKDLEQYKGKDVLVISHGGVLKYLKFCLAGKDIKRDKLEILDIENCKIEEFEF